MRRLFALILYVAALACCGQAAHAHAVLLAAAPADGAVLAEAPREITLRFNEPVAPVVLRVLGGDGRVVAEISAARVENDTIHIGLPQDLPAGSYIVSYRVISLDSHPVAGSLLFAVGAPSAAGRDAAEINGNTPDLRAAVAAIRALFILSLLLAAGGVLALSLVSGFAPQAVQHSRRISTTAALAAFAIGVLLLGLSGCRLLGVSATALTEAAPWRVAINATIGQSLTVAATGLALMLLFLPRLETASGRAGAVIGACVAVASFACTGHAATTSPVWLMGPAIAIHALCAAFWIGSLHPLLGTLRFDQPDRAREAVSLFSTYAAVAVGLILVLGAIIAFVQIGEVAMLWQSAYGLTLCAKLATVMLLLALAIHNKWHATPLLSADFARGLSRLRAAIYGEYALFAVILALTAALGQLEPGRVAAQHHDGHQHSPAHAHHQQQPPLGSADFRETTSQGGYAVTLWVTPAMTGHSALVVSVDDSNGNPFTPKEIELELSLPAEGIEAMHRRAERDSSGQFVFHCDDLVRPGHWRMDVHVLINDFTKRIVSFDVPIQ